MTFESLYGEVLELGFEDGAYPTASVQRAANRALATIYSERRLRKLAYLHTAGLPRKLPLKDMTVDGKRELSLPNGGVSLTAFGEGTVTFVEGEERREYKVKGQTFIRECVKDGRLIIEGAPSLMLREVSIYPNYRGDRKRLPAGGMHRFDLREEIADFGAAVAAPRDATGLPIASEIYGGVMLIPESFSGRITVEYLPVPTPISDTEGYNEIDLPRELCPLLPLLTAYYVWLDAEEEKAICYLERYRELSAMLPSSYISGAEKYITNGWA